MRTEDGRPLTGLAPDTVSTSVQAVAARAAEKLRTEELVAGRTGRIGALLTTQGFGQGPHRSAWLDEGPPEATGLTR